QSETVWRQADRYGVPRIAFVNKMDRVGADFLATIETMKDKLGTKAVAVQLPIGAEDSFRGIVDLIRMQAIIYIEDEKSDTNYTIEEIPADMLEQAKAFRGKMIEALAEEDEMLLDKYVHGHEPSEQELVSVMRKATLDGIAVPVLCGASFKNKGVQLLLDAVVDYMPGPLDVPPIKGINPKNDQEEARKPDDSEPFSALAFKIMTDPYVGKLTYFRVYSGSTKKGTAVYNTTSNSRERLGRLLEMHANDRKDIDEVFTGDIVAAVGLKHVSTGDTLCSEDHKIILESMLFPEPVISMAIEPKTRADRDKLQMALHKMTEEDPTFKISSNQETGQTIISGMGELHLDIIKDRMFREFQVQANVGAPQVAFRETITAPCRAEGKFIKQSGGRGQYGHVVINVEPMEKGAGFLFVDNIIGGVIPKEFIKSVKQGVEEAAMTGVLGGYPVVDMKVTLEDGSYHDVDSSDLAFKMAGSIGFKDAVKRAKPILLEPIMRVDVTTPEEYMGEVIGDINSRRGKVTTIDSKLKTRIIKAEVPLKEMFGYATSIRSLTKGRASYSMEPSHFNKVPRDIEEQILDIKKEKK
ncbi:MAG TPA: elongation factor G, partial [bacterium]|nr:elongation factor G [bacterium]